MKRLKFTLKAWPVIAVATIGLCYLTQLVAGWFGIALPGQQQVASVKAHAGWNLVFLSVCVQVLVLFPVVKEFVFRYLVWKLPDPRRVWGLAVISSALFSAAHYIQSPFPDAAFVALFFFGLAQCWIYRRTGRIWCAMLNHALFNALNLVLLFILPEGMQP